MINSLCLPHIRISITCAILRVEILWNMQKYLRFSPNNSANKGSTHWPLGNFNDILDMWFSNGFQWLIGWGISCEIALIWMSLDFTDDQSTLVQVMACCCQATSHYLSQCWPSCLSPYGFTRPEWVNRITFTSPYDHIQFQIKHQSYLTTNGSHYNTVIYLYDMILHKAVQWCVGNTSVFELTADTPYLLQAI